MKLNDLNDLKMQIENLPKIKQIHILHILDKNGVIINYNFSGSLVNLTFVPDNVISQIIEYINTADSKAEN